MAETFSSVPASKRIQLLARRAAMAGSMVVAFVGILVSTGDAVQAQDCAAFSPSPTELPVTTVPIVVSSTPADYFVLYARHDVDGTTVEYPVQVVLGQSGTTTLSENVAALPPERYRVERYSVDYPADVDGDCVDDITELVNSQTMSPVNPAEDLELPDRFAVIPDHETYERLAHVDRSGGEHLKFVIADIDTDRPSVYFQDTKRFQYHTLLSELGSSPVRGTMTYDPGLASPDGSLGVYRYVVLGRPSLALWDRIHTLLAASMPVLDDNLALWIWNTALPQVQADLQSDQSFRANIVLDADVYGSSGFLALNPGEGYGLLRNLEADERPHSRDVVIYEALPNELPRVAGIISTVPQTPLSHVNLRALQNGVPNAYIADALDDADISELIGRHVHYAVSDSGYAIRAATQAEVDEFYASLRPTETQTPQRNLGVTSITPLGEIGFEDWNAFGVKAANVAVMGTLGFPSGTVPDGFAVPFYFYDEFMKHNGLYDDITEMLADSDFQSDFDTRVDELKKLRKRIKKAETPDWMETALTAMHASFGEDTSLRYRSSTNNEDLPDFNGAGLYDSKTQHPSETTEDGISKSLKQVYASLWNYRAFDERDFHRIDHLAAAMGVLVHPNYSDEPVNGVAASIDPAYGTEGTHYVNSQLGEDLVTNPEAHSVPEELLLYPDGTYTVVALSNQVPPAQLLMTNDQLAQLRRYLDTIHERFAQLYAVEEDAEFAIEIEFKITSDNILAIKQARPWVFTSPPPDLDTAGVALTGDFSNPPATHDGSPFTVRIRFSENITLGFEEFKNHSVTATGGTVTSVVRVHSRDDFWEIRVSPNRRLEDISLVLAHDRSCRVVGAVCTTDGRRLSNRLEHTVNAPPPAAPQGLTATAQWSGIVDLGWSDVARADSYEVQFSRPIPPGPKLALWDGLPAGDTAIAFYGAGAVIKDLPLEPLQFRVRAVGPHGASDWSEELFVASTGNRQDWSETSEPTNYSATGAPTIRGTPKVLAALRADVSGIADDNGLARVKFRYQWTRSEDGDTSDIEGATQASYSLAVDDAGTSIGVRVSFVDRHGFAESLSSDPDDEVLVNTPAAGRPTILGAPRVGETLTVDTAGIEDADGRGDAGYGYQWVRTDGTTDTDIGEAAGSSYTLTWDDEGNAVKARVTFIDGTGGEESLTSAATEAVEPAAGEIALEAELGAGQESGIYPAMTGYSVFGSLDATLTSDRFAFEGDTYVVQFLVHASDGLWLGLNDDLPVDFTLRVNDAAYHASESKIPATVPGTSAYWWPSKPPAWLDGDPAQVSLTLHQELPLEDRPTAPVSGYLRGLPAEHDGSEDFSFRVYFSEGVATTAESLRDHVLVVSGGAVSRVDAVGGNGRIWAVTVTPSAWAPITISVGAERDCNLPEAICTEDARRLFNSIEAVVPTPPNRPPTGTPIISGEVEVGRTLTVDTSGISDADGLTDVTFSYQWISNVGWRDTVIRDATGPAYTPVRADAGRAITVQVSFRDDAGKMESLTSPARTERPRALTAVASDGAVLLTWEIPEHWGYADDFHILRTRPELGETLPLVRLTHAPAGRTTYTDTDVEPDVLYEYRVRGSDYFGFARDSSESVEIKTPVSTPVENSPATGNPEINGLAQVGELLTADTSGIADINGLRDAVFDYQWLAGTTVISGATGTGYTPTDVDENQPIKVRVTFTDDEGNLETRTSAATDPVSAAPTPLTAQLVNVPASHDGQSAFTFELHFNEEPVLSYLTLRDSALTVTGGEVASVRRLDRSSNIGWEINMRPGGNEDVRVVLPATDACDDEGAICTNDGRPQSHRTELTILGPDE